MCDSRGPTGSVQAKQDWAEKEAKQIPEAAAPKEPKPKATPGPQPSTRRRQCLSEAEDQQDPQPVWDREPQFWRDALTWELWKLLTDGQDNQQAERGEGPSLAGCGERLGCPGKPHCSPSLSSLPVVMATEKPLRGVSTLG